MRKALLAAFFVGGCTSAQPVETTASVDPQRYVNLTCREMAVATDQRERAASRLPGNRTSAFLAGTGNSSAIIPAIGSGMRASEQVDERQSLKAQIAALEKASAAKGC